MHSPPPPSVEETERMLHTYGDMLYRTALVLLGCESDAEDALQETILAWLQKAPLFEGKEHEKAWLLRVLTNRCRDMRRFQARHPQLSLDELPEGACDAEESGILEALASLPERFKLVLLLHYVEGYRVEEIAPIIGRTPSAVKMRLQKGRRLLEEAYRKEYL